MKNILKNIEPLLFFGAICLVLIPVFSFTFVPTLDGPAHLYNSNLINDLLFHSNKNTGEYFKFNPEPVPNWTGHAILSFFNFFLPAYMAQKILIVFYVAGMSYSFRWLVKLIAPSNTLMSYMIFPFIYSFLFFLGFYNFVLGILFMLLAAAYWVKYDQAGFKRKQMIILFLLIILTYFSHLFMFCFLLLLIGLHIIGQAAILFMTGSNSKEIITSMGKKIILIVSVSIIPIILGCLFYFSRDSVSGNPSYVAFAELTDWIKNMRALIAFDMIEEGKITKKIFYFLLFLLSIAFFLKINRISSAGETLRARIGSVLKTSFELRDIWLILSLIVLYLYFTLPDAQGYSGYVSIRLGLIFFIFLSTWICLQPFPKWVMILTAVSIVYINHQRTKFYMKDIGKMNELAVETSKAGEKIEPNSIVFSVVCTDNWTNSHFADYLGIDKPMVILENYECGLDWFPLEWNREVIPTTKVGELDLDNSVCFGWKWKTYEGHHYKDADYVYLLGNFDLRTDSCSNVLRKNITDHYELASSGKNSKLFKLKK